MPYSIDRYSSNLFDPSAHFPLTINDRTINASSTSLRLVGRDISNYGELIAENFVFLLENFAGITGPNNPITGQLWWKQDPTGNDSEQKLFIWNGSVWKAVSGATSGTTAPPNPSNGDVWYDITNQTFHFYSTNSWKKIFIESPTSIPTNPGAQPPTNVFEGQLWYNTTSDVLSVSNGTIWEGLMKTRPNSGPTTSTWISYENINGNEVIMITVGGNILAIWSAANILVGQLWNGVTPSGKPNLQSLFPNGLNVGLNFSSFGGNGISSNGTRHYGDWILDGGASLQATYADMAERYAADAIYEPGTLVRLGGSAEVTATTNVGDAEVFGVVSTNPAFLLNTDAGTNETHPAIALAGRVPVKVKGKVKKGQRLISSDIPGVAQALNYSGSDSFFAVFGRALEDKDSDDVGLVEVTVGAK